MDKVVLDGVTYVRSADAAEQFGYTSDYVGQLCRSKKIDARLVGRSWYVNLDSVKVYRKQKHTKRRARLTEKKSEKANKNKVKINSPDRRKNLTIHTDTGSTKKTEVKIRYENDTSELLPNVGRSRKQPESTEVPDAKPPRAKFVDLGELSGQTVPVKAERIVSVKVESPKQYRAGTELVATELPTVALKGTLQVSDADLSRPESLDDETAEVVDNKVENTSKIKGFLIKISSILLWPLRIVWKLLFPIRYIVGRVWTLILLVLRPILTLANQLEKKLSKKPPQPVSFAPKSLQQPVPASAPSSAVPAAPKTHPVVTVLSLVVSAILLGILVLSIGSQTVVGDVANVSNFFIDRTWISTLFLSR